MIAGTTTSELLLNLSSPGFSTVYLDIINKQTIPPDVLRAMERSWLRKNFRPHFLTIHRLTNVYVVGEGLVFDTDVRPFEPTVWPLTPDDVAHGQQLIQTMLRRGPLPRHDRPTILCKKAGSHNYGHWLIEMLPKALLTNRMIGKGYAVVVQEVEGPLTEIMDRTLSLAGFAGDDVIKIGGEPVFFNELLVVSGLTRHGSYMSPLVPLLVNELAAGVSAESKIRKVYVARSDTSRRHIVNEDTLRSALEAAEFTTVVPGQISFDQQLDIFRSADVLVGAAGAEFSNLVFSHPNATVITLVPHTMPDTFFWFLSQHRKLRYIEVRGMVQGNVAGRSWNQGFSIETEDLLAALALVDQAHRYG